MSPAAPKVSAAGGQEVLQAHSTIPLRPVERPLVEQAVPLQPGGPTAEQGQSVTVKEQQRRSVRD